MSSRPVPTLGQINLVVSDLKASLAFYRRLGLPIEPAKHPDWEAHHARAELPGGLDFELDSIAFAKQWNRGARIGASPGGTAVMFFELASRDEVDRVYAEVVAAGHAGQQPPIDAFWGARYAIVEDPDGYPIGLTCPVDDARRTPPPLPPR